MLLPLYIRQDLSKSQDLKQILALCRATGSDTVLALWSWAPPNPSLAPATSPEGWYPPGTRDPKREVALHHTGTPCLSQTPWPGAGFQGVLTSILQPWLLAYSAPNIRSNGERGKSRDEPELSSRTRQQQPCFNASHTARPRFGPCIRTAASPSPPLPWDPGEGRVFTCAMKGVTRAPTRAIPLHVPSPSARVAVG